MANTISSLTSEGRAHLRVAAGGKLATAEMEQMALSCIDFAHQIQATLPVSWQLRGQRSPFLARRPHGYYQITIEFPCLE